MNGAAFAGLEATEVPAGAALDAIDAAPVEPAIDAELPAEAAPLVIIEDAAIDEPMTEEPIIIEEAIEEPAIEEATAEEEAGAALEPPPPTDEAQAQTAAAEVCTASPVVGPQVARTHPKAALLIAALLAAPHWQT